MSIWDKASPSMKGDQGDERRVKAYLASVVHKLCGVFPNPYLWIPFKGGIFVVEDQDLVFLYGLTLLLSIQWGMNVASFLKITIGFEMWSIKNPTHSLPCLTLSLSLLRILCQLCIIDLVIIFQFHVSVSNSVKVT